MNTKTNTVTMALTISNCIDCPHHSVNSDPDHLDPFCFDDVKVVCTKAKRNITVACRPYNTRKESLVPNWCPLSKAANKDDAKL